MRNILITVALIFSPVFAFGVEDDPVALTINGEPIKKSEFEYIYKKNSSVSSSEKKSIDEYVEMFVNYKLKVLDAKMEEMNQKPTYLQEFERYENQLTIPYMTDGATEKRLIKEAYDRKKESVLASHILIKCKDKDTLEAWTKINSIYEKLKSGHSFGNLAKEFSECPSGKIGGDLGYVDVFSTVYDFENMLYATPVGSYSYPFRTEFGYHIVKVFDKKTNYEKKGFSHILIKSSTPNYIRVADSLFNVLKLGKDKFEDLAKKHSEDVGTAAKGGFLGYLEDGTFPDPIVNEVNSLKNVGDFSYVRTTWGIHIVSLTELVPFGDLSKYETEIKDKIKKSGRSKISEMVYEKNLLEKYGVEVYDDALKVFTSIVKENNAVERRNRYYNNLDAPLYTFEGNTYPQVDFLRYFTSRLENFDYMVKSGRLDPNGKKPGQLTADNFAERTFNAYLYDKMMDKERLYLRETNSEFRNLMTEYSDGLLLFEISTEKVWNKAVYDTTGLREYFEKNKEKYKWSEPRYKGIVVSSATDKIKKRVDQIMNSNREEDIKGEILKEFNTTASDEVMVREGLFPKGKNHAVDVMMFKEGEYKNEKYPYVSLRGSLISAPECYEDVKGLVTADYQDYLEKEWVKSLREKYKVKVNKDVLKTIK
jgi:peptidyl-prolyl cis-trans isomerase SurA